MARDTRSPVVDNRQLQLCHTCVSIPGRDVCALSDSSCISVEDADHTCLLGVLHHSFTLHEIPKQHVIHICRICLCGWDTSQDLSVVCSGRAADKLSYAPDHIRRVSENRFSSYLADYASPAAAQSEVRVCIPGGLIDHSWCHCGSRQQEHHRKTTPQSALIARLKTPHRPYT